MSKNSAAQDDTPTDIEPTTTQLTTTNNWSTAKPISAAGNNAYKPVIRYSPVSNAMLIVYDQQMSSVSDNNDPYAAISRNNGTTWIPAPISTTSGKSDQVKGLIDRSNNAFGVWIEQTIIEQTIIEQTIADEPKPDLEYSIEYGIKPDIKTNAGNSEDAWKKGTIMTFDTIQGQLLRDPAIAVDAANTVHVVWVKQDFTQTSIYYAYRLMNDDFNGNNYKTWSNPILIASPGPPVAEPGIAVDKYGKVHIAWQEEPDPGEIEIRYVRGKVSASGTAFNIDANRDRIKLSPDSITEAMLPILYTIDTQLHIVFSNQVNGGAQQSALYASCTLPCNMLASSNFKTITGSFVSSNDTDPYFLFADIGYDTENKSAHVFFHGDDGVAASNNELVMGVASCDNWLVRERVTDAASYRAIRPTIAIQNETVFLAYDKVVSNTHRIYVQSRPLDCTGLVYLPIIVK